MQRAGQRAGQGQGGELAEGWAQGRSRSRPGLAALPTCDGATSSGESGGEGLKERQEAQFEWAATQRSTTALGMSNVMLFSHLFALFRLL